MYTYYSLNYVIHVLYTFKLRARHYAHEQKLPPTLRWLSFGLVGRQSFLFTFLHAFSPSFYFSFSFSVCRLSHSFFIFPFSQ